MNTLAGYKPDDANRFADIERSWSACSESIARWFGFGPMSVEYPGDRDYGAASWFNKSFRSPKAQSAQIHSVVASYQANMERVSSMHTLPLALVYWVARNTKNNCAAAQEVGEPILDALSPDVFAKPAFAAAVKRLEDEETANAVKNFGGPMPHAALAADFGAHHIKRIIHRQIEASGPYDTRDQFTIGGVESILFSMVTSSYAAFETLAADMWIESLNAYPQPLAVNWCTKHNTKKITLEELAGHGFDVSRRMGTLLTEEDGASFQRLHNIKGHYCDAFGVGVASCFEPEDLIYLASKLRNLIAHRGGIIDQKFNKEVNRFPEYASQPVGSHLLLTGEMARQQIDACVDCSLRIIRFVDDWMVSNVSKAY